MQNQNITGILRKLHTNTGIPRLEIEGAGKPSIEAQYLNWIQHKKEGEGEAAVYVIMDWYEDTSYVTEYRTECLRLPKSGIEKLVQDALQSENREAAAQIKGGHIKHYERWDDYNNYREGSPAETRDVLIQLSLNLKEEEPMLSVKY